MRKDKKGLLGLDTVKAVLVALLVIAVVFVVVMLATSNLRDAAESAETKQTKYEANDSLGTVQEGSYTFDRNPQTVRNPVCTITKVTLTNGTTVTSTNYTQFTGDGCGVTYAGGGSVFNNSEWYAVYSYKYNTGGAYDTGENLTQGARNFIKQVPTFFVLLGVVVLILIISIVIIAVTRFQGGAFGGPRGATTELSD